VNFHSVVCSSGVVVVLRVLVGSSKVVVVVLAY